MSGKVFEMTQTQVQPTYPPLRHVNTRQTIKDAILPDGQRRPVYASAASLVGVFDALVEAAMWRGKSPLTEVELADTRAALKAAVSGPQFDRLLEAARAQIVLVEAPDAPHTPDPLTMLGQFGRF
jgi:hypothetical protein